MTYDLHTACYELLCPYGDRKQSEHQAGVRKVIASTSLRDFVFPLQSNARGNLNTISIFLFTGLDPISYPESSGSLASG